MVQKVTHDHAIADGITYLYELTLRADNKDILAIRFPTNRIIKQNKIINNIMSGKGFVYDDNKIWYPKEVWIYNPIN